jgi:hypothetical protein
MRVNVTVSFFSCVDTVHLFLNHAVAVVIWIILGAFCIRAQAPISFAVSNFASHENVLMKFDKNCWIFTIALHEYMNVFVCYCMDWDVLHRNVVISLETVCTVHFACIYNI